MNENPSTSTARDSRFEPVRSRLAEEFSDVHHTSTVTRCGTAPRT